MTTKLQKYNPNTSPPIKNEIIFNLLLRHGVGSVVVCRRVPASLTWPLNPPPLPLLLSNQAILICYKRSPSGPYYTNPCDVIPKHGFFVQPSTWQQMDRLLPSACCLSSVHPSIFYLLRFLSNWLQSWLTSSTRLQVNTGVNRTRLSCGKKAARRGACVLLQGKIGRLLRGGAVHDCSAQSEVICHVSACWRRKNTVICLTTHLEISVFFSLTHAAFACNSLVAGIKTTYKCGQRALVHSQDLLIVGSQDS